MRPAATNINDLVLTAALASCLMFADRDECPASSKFGLGILMHHMIGSSDKVLDNAARAATAVALRCKQLHGRLALLTVQGNHPATQLEARMIEAQHGAVAI